MHDILLSQVEILSACREPRPKELKEEGSGTLLPVLTILPPSSQMFSQDTMDESASTKLFRMALLGT